MKLSTRAGYGMRAMIDLALHYEKDLVLLKDIARREEISAKYLDHIVSSLRAAGLVESPKARHGGYALSRPPSQIKALEVFQALEGPLALVPCAHNPNICHRVGSCASLNLWKRLEESMRATLEEITLEDLAEEQRELDEQDTDRGTYHI